VRKGSTGRPITVRRPAGSRRYYRRWPHLYRVDFPNRPSTTRGQRRRRRPSSSGGTVGASPRWRRFERPARTVRGGQPRPILRSCPALLEVPLQLSSFSARHKPGCRIDSSGGLIRGITLATYRGKSSRTFHPGSGWRTSLCRCGKARRSSARDVVTRYKNAIPADRTPIGSLSGNTRTRPRRPGSDRRGGQAFRLGSLSIRPLTPWPCRWTRRANPGVGPHSTRTADQTGRASPAPRRASESATTPGGAHHGEIRGVLGPDHGLEGSARSIGLFTSSVKDANMAVSRIAARRACTPVRVATPAAIWPRPVAYAQNSCVGGSHWGPTER
jgi:hypothetical protein